MTGKVHFTNKWPLKKDQQRSIYYWFHQYLLRGNFTYPLTVNATKQGFPYTFDIERPDPVFWTFWKAEGVRLFGEEPIQNLVVHNPDTIPDKIPSGCIGITLPIYHPALTMDYLTKRFRDIVKPYLTDRWSSALMQITSSFDLLALETQLIVYDYHIANPDKTLYQIAEDLHKQRLVSFGKNQLVKSTDTPSEISDKKKTMSSIVSRYIKDTKAIINNIPTGVFPKKDSPFKKKTKS